MDKLSREDLSAAYDLVGMNWSTERWKRVDDTFGQDKSAAILEHFKTMENAFWAIKPRHSTGSSVMHDAKTVTKDFKATHPEAPEDMVQKLRYEYLYRYR